VRSENLREVRLLGVPVGIHQRAREQRETLRRELAFVEHASDPEGAPARLHELARILEARYGALTAPQQARLDAAVAAGESTVDLDYQLPLEVADACDELEAVLEELDEFCREGDLLTLVTSEEARVYRRWHLDEVREQLREGRPPRPWSTSDELGQLGDEHAAAPAAAAREAAHGRPVGDATVVVDEDLDLGTAPALREQIVSRTDAGYGRIVVDVSGCTFMDSTGLSLLLTIHQRLAAEGGSLRVVGAAGQVASVLEISGVADLLVGPP
jgi:anti-sigma B factor antagonist